MELKDLLSSVRNHRIQFATARSPDSQFATLDRRVLVTGPAELVELSEIGDVRVLDELVKLLREPDRAWAAAVVLANLTRREEKLIDAFAASPATWWDAVGKTAWERWSAWLGAARETLVWEPDERAFVERR